MQPCKNFNDHINSILAKHKTPIMANKHANFLKSIVLENGIEPQTITDWNILFPKLLEAHKLPYKKMMTFYLNHYFAKPWHRSIIMNNLFEFMLFLKRHNINIEICEPVCFERGLLFFDQLRICIYEEIQKNFCKDMHLNHMHCYVNHALKNFHEKTEAIANVYARYGIEVYGSVDLLKNMIDQLTAWAENKSLNNIYECKTRIFHAFGYDSELGLLV